MHRIVEELLNGYNDRLAVPQAIGLLVLASLLILAVYRLGNW